MTTSLYYIYYKRNSENDETAFDLFFPSNGELFEDTDKIKLGQGSYTCSNFFPKKSQVFSKTFKDISKFWVQIQRLRQIW